MNSIPLLPVYKRDGKTSSLLSDFLYKPLTLNVNQYSGFDEIGTLTMDEKLPEDKKYLTGVCEKWMTDQSETIKTILDVLESVVFNILTKEGPKIFLTSAGADSRILSGLVKRIERVYGRHMTDQVLFVCGHPEVELFKRAMICQGWGKKKYHIHKEDHPINGDYYGIGDWYDCNAFCASPINLWSDVIPAGEEKNYYLVFGIFGNNVFHQSLVQYVNHFDDRYRYIGRKEKDYSAHGFLNSLFKGYFYPYLDYDFLDVGLRIHRSLIRHHQLGLNPKRIDNLRRLMLYALGDFEPTLTGRTYSLELTPERQNFMRFKWYNSAFYRDYGLCDEVQNAVPWKAKRGSIDNKLYSLATCYEPC